jgi:hypothetical protein
MLEACSPTDIRMSWLSGAMATDYPRERVRQSSESGTFSRNLVRGKDTPHFI